MPNLPSVSFLSIEKMSKAYPGRTTSKSIYRSFSLDVSHGEVLSVIGPNGSGKTTLLKLAAGLLDPDAGSITIGGLPSRQTPKGFAFQDFRGSLFAWHSNLENVFIGIPGAIREKSYRSLVDPVFKQSSIPEEGFPYELSGGQQQMLSVLRAMIAVRSRKEPSVAFLDEPFRAMDYHNRSIFHQLFLQLVEVGREEVVTTVLVSHDVEEAVYLADRVVILPKPPIEKALSIPISLPRPRTIGMQDSETFLAILKKVKAQFHAVLGLN